ncbi:hypothetical protein H2198_000034 [Neophaeococcomyces mojaviensis]|uniref:Uncharacterized protein n=1 Tax=Neophaeococcomyces mojaviensis TaxID=3383035 RepID=A0ACC3AKS7_9EURO|nr:hypothetical protein H2198_000034 [Knufia sp. JES_112]
MSLSPSPGPQAPPSKIDRQQTTPFLLHLCYRSSAFHNLADFPLPTPSNPTPPLPTHLQIYTWYSCTLRELAHLLTTALPGIVPDPAIGTRLSFRLVYPDTSAAARGVGGRLGEEGRGRYTSKEMGSVVVAPQQHSNGHGVDDEKESWELGGDDAEKTLAEARFVIGDYVDCAVFPPLSDGSVVPRGVVPGRGSNGHGRSRGGASYGVGRGGHIPAGEWRRGERIPESGGGYRGGGRGGYGRAGRREPY